METENCIQPLDIFCQTKIIEGLAENYDFIIWSSGDRQGLASKVHLKCTSSALVVMASGKEGASPRRRYSGSVKAGTDRKGLRPAKDGGVREPVLTAPFS
jgi:hypothetical protein